VVPLVRKTAAALTVWLGERFATSESGGVRIEADLDGLPALQPERDALWARLTAATFLTDEERRRMAGVGA
jgi:phage portal protein BeeE